MWIAVNKDGKPHLFELPPRRFHDGACLEPRLVGFNDAVTVGDGKDTYSFWAEQKYHESNLIDDSSQYGMAFFREEKCCGQRIYSPYVPEIVQGMSWEDDPVEVELALAAACKKGD